MKVVEDVTQLPSRLPFPVLGVGVFDGVHCGHQEILRRLSARARARRGTAMVLTFHPHPKKVLSPQDAPPLLQTPEQKLEVLSRLGLDLMINLPFTKEFSLLTPEQFSREVLYPLRIREIHVGKNFRFGHRRAGDFETLKALGAKYDFQVFDIEPVLFRGQRISSTRIRNLLTEGRVELVRRLLGRPYAVRGRVVRGAGKGTAFGFPTANLQIENELIPATGIYATRTWVEGAPHPSVSSIGYRPTLYREGESELVVESHILDLNAELYGKTLSLEFCLRIRPEQKFETIQALKDKIAQDVSHTRRYLKRRKSGVSHDVDQPKRSDENGGTGQAGNSGGTDGPAC